MSPSLEHLFDMRGTLAAPLDVGPGPEGHRQILPVAGGTVAGPALNGEVVPGTCADWARVRPDGSFALDVRLVIRAENDDLIYMTYGGRIFADTAEGQALALDFGKSDPSTGADQYYFRINPLFETASKTFGWLNRIVAIGTGQSGGGGVTYRIYQVK
ncbi:MAG: DUF3237 domain-containing protein [Pseudomonadota bacterium]